MDLIQLKKRTYLTLFTGQFRPPIHDLDITHIAEQPIAFLGGQLLEDAKPLQMTKGFVHRGWYLPYNSRFILLTLNLK